MNKVFMFKRRTHIFLLCGLSIIGVVSDKAFIHADTAIKNTDVTKVEKPKFVDKFAVELALIGSFLTFCGIGATAVSVLNGVEKNINARLSIVEKGLHDDILMRHDVITKDLLAIRQELFLIQTQFQHSIDETRQELLKINHKFETAMVLADSNYELLQKEYINLQKELQYVLRQFHTKVADIEDFLLKNHEYIPRKEHFNINIEGL